YHLDVIAIPTNKPVNRINSPDVIFRTEKEKWDAVVEEIAEVNKTGRPMLIGTTDVDKSIKLSGMLKRRGVKHELLNALPEHAAREAEIVAQAGRINAVTIATNMARRIDNQLRSRSGRQGDPGSGRFYLSLEDDLMRIFAGEWVKNMLTRLGMEDGQAIESRMVSRRIEGAQKKVEERNFDIRKNLLEYDEVMDHQRKRVYGYRQEILDGGSCKIRILDMLDEQIEEAIDRFLDDDYGASGFAQFASNRLGVEF